MTKIQCPNCDRKYEIYDNTPGTMRCKECKTFITFTADNFRVKKGEKNGIKVGK